jgi:protein-tyrosine phosphatase
MGATVLVQILFSLLFLTNTHKSVTGTLVTEEQCHAIRVESEAWKPVGESTYNDADLIIDQIYLGNVCAAHNSTWLIEKNISAVFNIAVEWSDTRYEGVKLVSLPLDDLTSLDERETRRAINKVTHLLISYKEENANASILIHCNMGISRSATVLIRYLQLVHDMSYREALLYVKARRGVAKPNHLFKKILIKQDL